MPKPSKAVILFECEKSYVSCSGNLWTMEIGKIVGLKGKIHKSEYKGWV